MLRARSPVIALGLLAMTVVLTPPAAAGETLRLVLQVEESAVDRSLAVLEQRLDAWAAADRASEEAGVVQNILDEVSGWLSGKPYTIDRQGRDRIVVTLPPGQDPGAIRPILTRRGVMTFRAVASDVSIRDAREGRLPAGTTLLPERGSGEAGNEHELVVRDEVLVDGANLVEAEAMRDWFDRPAVTIRFDDIGTENFGHATANAIGERIAIVVDDEVISAPVINEPILDGVAQISGAFTVQEANDLALILRAGALPAPVTIISEQWLSGESDE